MAMRNIVKDGDPVLKKVSRPVTKFDDRLAELLDDMGETMLEADGLGLAAPQVGILRRIFVALDITAEEEKDEEELEEMEEDEEGEEGDVPEEEEAPPHVLEFINPEILETEGNILGYEGCLSFPGQYGAIERPTKVTVKAQDRTGKELTLTVTGMMARCVCHETNHLDGITIPDLAQYFYDPKNPHELDDNFATEDETQEEDGEE
ncbi:MAG: peptide deformylase [Oscillospiraceae bacterium]